MLIADDNPDMLRALEAVLSRESDLEIAGTACGGEDAIRLAAELAPDVIVLDRSMPDLDGIDAMGQIKEQRPEIAIVMLTAHADARVAQSALAAGASGYVVKDTAFEELARAVRTVYGKKVYLSARVGNRLLG